MFVKKDMRKIPKILSDAAMSATIDTPADETSSDRASSSKKQKREITTELRLSRRSSEFNGTLSILCHPGNAPALQNVISISLYDCQINTLQGIGLLGSSIGSDEDIICCPNLQELNVGRNPISHLPDELSMLRNLKTLWCDDCQIEGTIPNCLLELTQLETLRLSNNKITSIPKEIEKMVNLKLLCLDGNLLESIPSELGKLEKMESLMLRKNLLHSLPINVPSPHQKKLSLLHISSNKLECLPESIVRCVSLKTVYANANLIKEIPSGMVECLTNLTRLNLNCNEIKSLPDDFLDRFGEPDTESGLCQKDPNCTVLLGRNPIIDEIKKKNAPAVEEMIP